MKDLFIDWKEGRIKVNDFREMNNYNYSILPLDESEKAKQSATATYLHSKFTRRTIVAFVVILVLSTAFVLIACIGGSISSPSVCNDHKLIPKKITHVKNNLRYQHTKRRLPHCIIIGVRKGGTRALLNYLKIHPDVQVAPDEIHFFDDNNNYSKGLQWYRKRMPYSFAEQITIEKTPNYFVDWKTPDRVKNMNSSIKLLLIVRDPVYRAISDYTQIRAGRIDKDLEMEDFEDLAIDFDTNKVRRSYKAINRSLYYYHTKHWLNKFSLTQLHVVDGDRLVHHPYEEVKKVETFLGLRHAIQESNFVFDRKKGFFCIKKEHGHKCLNKTKGRKHAVVDKSVIRQLNKFFEPYNEKFFTLVGKKFDWPVLQKGHSSDSS